MHKNQPQLTHARDLREAILAAPQVWLPRREILLEWLNAFLERAGAPRAELQPTDTTDLADLESFLRKLHVPVT